MKSKYIALRLRKEKAADSSDEAFRMYGFDPSSRDIPFKRFCSATPRKATVLRGKFYGAIHATSLL